MDRVAITGATGFLGGNVAEAFLSAGWRVRAICRPSSDARHLAHLPLDWRKVSFGNTDELAQEFAGVAAVVHCAGVTLQSPRLRPEHWLGNITATRLVLDACQRAGVRRLIHCSSTVTCGFAASETPVTEERADLSNPPWPDGYFISKREAERHALMPGNRLDVIVVNPGYMLGPLDAKPSSGQLVLAAGRGFAIGWPSGYNNFVDVRDVAAGILAALHRGRPRQRYILGGKNLSYRELLTRVATATDRRVPFFAIAYPFAAGIGRLGDVAEALTGHCTNINSSTVRYAFWDGTRYTSEKAVRELGYRARPIEETIKDAVDWFRQTGALFDKRNPP